MLRDIYWQFIRGDASVDEAARQISEHAQQHEILVDSLEFEPLSEKQHNKVRELMDYLLKPIEQQYFRGEGSPQEAAARMAPILFPHGSWGLMLDIGSSSSTEIEQFKVLLDHLFLVLKGLENHDDESNSP